MRHGRGGRHRAAGGREDRHRERLRRCMVRGLHPAIGGCGVGRLPPRQRPYDLGPWHKGHGGIVSGSDLARVHGARLGGAQGARLPRPRGRAGHRGDRSRNGAAGRPLVSRSGGDDAASAGADADLPRSRAARACGDAGPLSEPHANSQRVTHSRGFLLPTTVALSQRRRPGEGRSPGLSRFAQGHPRSPAMTNPSPAPPAT